MVKGEAFLTPGDSLSGITRTAFRRLRRAEQKELMEEWFHQNFEDPANETPYESREGGYQYIWGGPYDAAEELGDKFGGLVPDHVIDEVAKRVQSDGLYEWAPVDKGDRHDPEPEDDTGPFERWEIDRLADVPGKEYGSAEDLARRSQAISELSALEEVLPAPGIGHNNPPSAIDGEEADGDVSPAALADAVSGAKAELQRDAPSIVTLKSKAHVLRRVVSAVAHWVGKKLDRAVDRVIDKGIDTAFNTVKWSVILQGTGIWDQLLAAYSAVLKWLETVTLPF
jgi:hypothetical protein